MFNSVALDVVIGLVFIYLLYSLLATVIGEIVAVKLNLRARNLKLAVGRMLNDEDEKISGIRRLLNTLNILNTAKDPKTTKFYNHAEIKYLGSAGLARHPSSFKAASFSKTIMFMLNDAGPVTKEKIDAMLHSPQVTNVFGRDTADYVISLWEDSYKDVVKFKLQLENWFDRTMEQTTEWYKRKIQVVLIVIGFLLAWVFNADTFVIVKKLSVDKKAREQMVNLASAYVENNRYQADMSRADSNATDQAKLDTLLSVKKRLDADISTANTLLGIGGWPEDSVRVIFDAKTGDITYIPAIDVRALPDTLQKTIQNEAAILSAWRDSLSVQWAAMKAITDTTPTARSARAELQASVNSLNSHIVKRSNTGLMLGIEGNKLCYFFKILWRHFFGFLVTAIAISLGAPFWFDMLNKLMQLRTSIKQEGTATNNSIPGNTVSPLNREA